MPQLINEARLLQLRAGLITEDQLNELDADVQKARDSYLKKLSAVSNAIQALHNDDGLFAVDKGAKQKYDAYLKALEANNTPWKDFYSYVKGTTAPALSGFPSNKTAPPKGATPPGVPPRPAPPKGATPPGVPPRPAPPKGATPPGVPPRPAPPTNKK